MLVDNIGLLPVLRPMLDEALRRIVEVARPRAVLLFGLYADGRADAHSDIDLLVIADTEDPGLLAQDLYGVDADLARGRWYEVPSLDILVLTPDQWSCDSGLPGQLAHHVKKHGVVVYGQLS